MKGFFGKFRAGFQRFMQGRYGSDKLNMALVWVSLGMYILNLLIPIAAVKLGLILASYVLIAWAFFRMLSRNTYKRYQENRKFLMLLDRIKDRQHKYFTCPRCKQPVRVPKGKGKIAIKCPKCGEKFIKKT